MGLRNSVICKYLYYHDHFYFNILSHWYSLFLYWTDCRYINYTKKYSIVSDSFSLNYVSDSFSLNYVSRLYIENVMLLVLLLQYIIYKQCYFIGREDISGKRRCQERTRYRYCVFSLRMVYLEFGLLCRRVNIKESISVVLSATNVMSHD